MSSQLDTVVEMTPEEAKQFSRLIRESVDEAVRPIQARIAALESTTAEAALEVKKLKTTDRRHSDEHRGLGKSIDQTRAELEKRMQEKVESTHELVAELHKAIKEGRTPTARAASEAASSADGAQAAAVAGAKASIDAKNASKDIATASASAAIDSDLAKQEAKKSRRNAFAAFLAVVFLALVDVAKELMHRL